MTKDKSAGLVWSRTHFMEQPEERKNLDRRKVNCFVADDKRNGIACRRKERQREIERKIAHSKVTFYPDYFRFI